MLKANISHSVLSKKMTAGSQVTRFAKPYHTLPKQVVVSAEVSDLARCGVRKRPHCKGSKIVYLSFLNVLGHGSRTFQKGRRCKPVPFGKP